MPKRLIRIKVKPNSHASSLTQLPDGSWLAHVKAAAIEGKANRELIGLVAEQFHCAKAQVSIRVGASGRLKLVSISTG